MEKTKNKKRIRMLQCTDAFFYDLFCSFESLYSQ